MYFKLIILSIIFSSCVSNPPINEGSWVIGNYNIDTVYVTDTVCLEKISKPKEIPPTLLKVSDVVCVWEEWTAVITAIEWNVAETAIIYRVSYPPTESNVESREEWFYETELTLGKCR